MGVASIECRAEIDQQLELAERLGGKACVGIRAIEIAAETQPDLELAAAAPSMQAIVSRPVVVGSFTPKWLCSRSKTACLRFGATPIEPIPCTFEWPRIGSNPQPG